MQCPNCQHEASAAAFGDPLCCPCCGAYYDKAILLKAKKEAVLAGPSQRIPSDPPAVFVLGRAIDKGLRAAAAAVTPAPKLHNLRGHFGKFYCPSCGQVGNGVRHVPGSIVLEIVLWLCFLMPGLIYSIWRHAATKKACRTCRQPGLIPVDSPRARRELGLD